MNQPQPVSKANMRTKIKLGKNQPGQYYTSDDTGYFAYSSLHGRSVGKTFDTVNEVFEWLKEVYEEGEKNNVSDSND